MPWDRLSEREFPLCVVVVDDVLEDWSTVETLLENDVGGGRVFGCRWIETPGLVPLLDDLERVNRNRSGSRRGGWCCGTPFP